MAEDQKIFTEDELDEEFENAPVISVDDIRQILIEQKDVRGGFQIVSTVPSHEEIEGRLLLYSATNIGVGVYRMYAKLDKGWRKIGDSQFITNLDIGSLTDVNLSSVAQGDVLYRDGTEWVNLAVGTDGQALTTQGSSANPKWSGMTTQGDVEYHSGSDRTRLAPGTSGEFLQTKGSSANPVWASASPFYVKSFERITVNFDGTQDFKSFLISANDIGVNGFLEVVAGGKFDTSSSSNVVTIKFGTASVVAIDGQAVGSIAYTMKALIMNRNSASAQVLHGYAAASDETFQDIPLILTSTEDTTANVTLHIESSQGDSSQTTNLDYVFVRLYNSS